jgi:hypothetical protein
MDRGLDSSVILHSGVFRKRFVEGLGNLGR